MDKLGLIAGGGDLPAAVARHCQAAGRPYFVIRVRDFADAAMADHPGADVGLAEFGKCFKTLKAQNCSAVCFAGRISRPDFSALKPDLRGMAALPGLIAAARQGDDALLRRVLAEFEKEGFRIEGVQQVTKNLTLPLGALGRHRPDESHQEDVTRALNVARAIGRMDIGQGAVSCRGLVLAVEAQEGTDGMLRRIADLPRAVRGEPGAMCGVLAKAPKPIQELRVDLPTIGLSTVQRAAKAGLAGIVGEAGRLLVLDRQEVIALADELGLFIVGVEPGDS